MWSNFWPVRMPLHSHVNLSSQVSRLKHQQPACVCPGDHPLCCHPGMTQEVDGLHLWEAALFQGSLWVAKQLEHTGSTHTELHVVVGVEADLMGNHSNDLINAYTSAGGCPDTAWMTHLSNRIIWVTGLHCGQDFLFFPKPEDQHPLWTTRLAYQVLGIRRESHAYKLFNKHLSCSQNFSLPALLMLQVEHCDAGLLSTLWHCQVTLVGTDGQSLHALAFLWACRDNTYGNEPL